MNTSTRRYVCQSKHKKNIRYVRRDSCHTTHSLRTCTHVFIYTLYQFTHIAAQVREVRRFDRHSHTTTAHIRPCAAPVDCDRARNGISVFCTRPPTGTSGSHICVHILLLLYIYPHMHIVPYTRIVTQKKIDVTIIFKIIYYLLLFLLFFFFYCNNDNYYSFILMLIFRSGGHQPATRQQLLSVSYGHEGRHTHTAANLFQTAHMRRVPS